MHQIVDFVIYYIAGRPFLHITTQHVCLFTCLFSSTVNRSNPDLKGWYLLVSIPFQNILCLLLNPLGKLSAHGFNSLKIECGPKKLSFELLSVLWQHTSSQPTISRLIGKNVGIQRQKLKAWVWSGRNTCLEQGGKKIFRDMTLR